MIRVSQLKLPVAHSLEDLKIQAAKELKVPPGRIKNLTVSRKSIDARKKPVMYVYTVDVTGSTNRELFASVSDEGIRSFIEDRAVVDVVGQGDELDSLMTEVAASLDRYEGGANILTDDKAPVELLGMRMIDELIGDELGYYKQIFQEQGLTGLLESL